MDSKDISIADSKAEIIEEKEKEPEREKWSRKIDFLLACVGFSVGLGNVWRFPYLCYKNGGGAFLFPYLICVVLGGIPMFFLEVSLGQFMNVGGIGAWMICPLFQGIGYATTIIVFCVNVYYNVILCWAFYYLFASFTSTLPWSHCDNDWNTHLCLRKEDNDTEVRNITKLTDPAVEYWERKVLHLSDGIEDMGPVRWDLALVLLLAWIVIYACICKGIKTSGKVMYVTATSPYLLMFVLLVRGVTLPGAGEGVKFYLNPDLEKIQEIQVWVDAGTQIFFSYSISLGALTALGSFNDFHHNCWKDCLIFACVNSGTSIFAGFVIFAVLGYMAHEQGVDVGDVAESGPGLAFIAYPKAVAQMPFAPPLWSILFFIMIILLGLDSQFVGVEGFVTAIVDEFPHILRKKYRKEIFIGCVCLLCYLIGLSMVAEGGMYVFQLFDYYAGSRIILLVAFFECVAVAWIYGVNRFYDNLTMMLGFRINNYMKYSWTVITPLFTIIMFSLSTYSYSALTYERPHNQIYEYPQWAIAIGWILACLSVTMIPVVMVIKILNTGGPLPHRLRVLIRPVLKPHQIPPQYSVSVRASNGLNGLNVSADSSRGCDNPAFTASPLFYESNV